MIRAYLLRCDDPVDTRRFVVQNFRLLDEAKRAGSAWFYEGAPSYKNFYWSPVAREGGFGWIFSPRLGLRMPRRFAVIYRINLSSRVRRDPWVP